MKKRMYPLYFKKGKKFLQIVVRISSAPGSLKPVVDLLAKKVSMVGITAYTLDDGTAIFSAIAEALSPGETPSNLEKAIRGSGAVKDVEVHEGQDGLLVDTFHTGLVVAGKEYLLMRRDGFNRVVDRMIGLFGSGGDTLLYEEGKAMGMDNAMSLSEELGSELDLALWPYLLKILTAYGWGTLEFEPGLTVAEGAIRVSNCMECADASKVRTGCNFLRGYLEGGVEAATGVPFKSEEVECTLRGDKECVFHLTMKH